MGLNNTQNNRVFREEKEIFQEASLKLKIRKQIYIPESALFSSYRLKKM